MSTTVHFHGGPEDGTIRVINGDAAPYELMSAGLPPLPASPQPASAVIAPAHVYRLAGSDLLRDIAHYQYQGER